VVTAVPLARVAAVCTGNICRSPMAEVAWRHAVGLDPELRGRVEVTSAGVAHWDVGQAMDPRARRALDRAGLTGPGTLAAFADAAYLARQDLVVVMTREHALDVRSRAGGGPRVVLVRDLAGDGPGLDLADPYYGDDAEFDACLEVITRAGRRLTAELRRRPGGPSSAAGSRAG
jgi:low molecular weight protein-tyrosine phosphatase